MGCDTVMVFTCDGDHAKDPPSVRVTIKHSKEDIESRLAKQGWCRVGRYERQPEYFYCPACREAPITVRFVVAWPHCDDRRGLIPYTIKCRIPDYPFAAQEWLDDHMEFLGTSRAIVYDVIKTPRLGTCFTEEEWAAAEVLDWTKREE